MKTLFTKYSSILIIISIILLSFSFGNAQAARTITLTWQYTQNSQRLATSFVVQRCVQSGVACTMADFVGATAIPVTTLTYIDTNVVTNQKYCYQVAAADSTGRSTYSSPVVCNGIFDLNIPTQVIVTIQ